MSGGFVHASGGRLVDGDGDDVVLHGVGLGNWLLPEGYMWRFQPPGPQSPRAIEALICELVGERDAAEFWRGFHDRFITEADIAAIAAEGLNHVRLPINSRVVIDEDGSLLVDGLELVDRLLEWSRAHGLWVVLDLHGAPGGQTGTNIDDSPKGRPALFTDPGYRELTIELWRALAERYRDDTTVAGYDLLNEPLPDTHQYKHADALVALYRDLTTTVRAADPHHLIVYEGTHWATNWSIFEEVWDPNSMLQFHRYWSPPDRASIAPYVDIGDRLGLPIYMGEGGENNTDWIHTAFQLYDDHHISWNFWTWKKIETRTSPYSVIAPPGWHDVLTYASGQADAPATDAASLTLRQLLDNVALDRCEYHGEVMAALLRRPPLRIPASGFGFAGQGNSYSTTAGEPLTGFRSDDLVTLHPTGTTDAALRFDHTDGTPRSADEEIHLELNNGEWVAYDISVADSRDNTIEIELAQPTTDQTAIGIAIDGTPVPLRIVSDHRLAGSARLNIGRHRIRLTGGAPDVRVRWLDVGR